MKPLPSRCVTTTLLLPLLLLLLLPVLGAGIPPQVGLSRRHGASGPLPQLSKLRDAMIDFFHRRIPPAEISPPPPPPAAAAAAAAPPRPVLSLEELLSRYDSQLVLRFSTESARDNAAVAEAAACLALDLWAVGHDFVDVRLHSDAIAPLLSHLPWRVAASHAVLIPDLAAAVHQSYPDFGPDDSRMRGAKTDRPEPQLADLWRFNDNFFFHDFQPLHVIDRWMRLLDAMFPHVEYLTVGTSFEGRDMPALRVRAPSPSGDDQGDDQGDAPRKVVVVTGGVHAREWISTTTVNYLAWSYISSLGVDRTITKFLTHFDVVFVPVVNPDGFEYTWSVDRLWRKSRQPTTDRNSNSNGNPSCRGIDLDHAFAFGWNSSGTQGDPCSGGYGGAAPFQAVEALRLADWARNETRRGVRIVGLLDLHAYSQQVLFPFSYSCAAEPPNLENLEELAAGLAKAIRLSNGESYSVASACEGALAAPPPRSGEYYPSDHRDEPSAAWPRLESAGGSAIDWFYHELGARFSYQIKLRDTGSYGFLLPKQYIIPTGEEMVDALKYYGDYILGNNGIESAGAGAAAPGHGTRHSDASSSQEL